MDRNVKEQEKAIRQAVIHQTKLKELNHLSKASAADKEWGRCGEREEECWEEGWRCEKKEPGRFSLVY